VSDHALVLLEFGVGIPTIAYPFKLNPVWIGEDSFAELVRDVWNDLSLHHITCAQRRLVGKLTSLKARVKLWAKEKHLPDMLDLDNIEEALENRYE
jgi:hypothetical protein